MASTRAYVSRRFHWSPGQTGKISSKEETLPQWPVYAQSTRGSLYRIERRPGLINKARASAYDGKRNVFRLAKQLVNKNIDCVAVWGQAVCRKMMRKLSVKEYKLMEELLVRRNRDFVGANCVKDSDEKNVVEEDRLMEVWRTHYDNTKHIKWGVCLGQNLTNVSPVFGSSERISALEVGAAIRKMKQGKSAGLREL